VCGTRVVVGIRIVRVPSLVLCHCNVMFILPSFLFYTREWREDSIAGIIEDLIFFGRVRI
jgi:hypothetical protein